MSWVAVGGLAVGAVGGALSGGKGGAGSASTTSQNTIDPRIASYLYGGSGGGGLLNNVNSLYSQQFGQGGLNPMQNAGLEMQRQAFMDPRYTQGYGQMRNLGGNLLNQGVAGNPFTGGGMAFGNPSMSQAGGAGGLVSPSMSSAQGLMGPASQPIQQQMAPPPAPITLQDLLAQVKQQPAPQAPGLIDDEYNRGHG